MSKLPNRPQAEPPTHQERLKRFQNLVAQSQVFHQVQRQLCESPEKEESANSTASKLSGVCNEAEGDKTPGSAANRPEGLPSDAPGGRLLDVQGGS